MNKLMGLVVVCLALSGCAATGKVEPLELTLPDGWSIDSPSGAGESVDTLWWQGLGSDELVEMVAQALSDSQDLGAAVARMRQAEALARARGASRLPVLNGRLSADHMKDATGTGSFYQAGLGASYDVDLWGGLAASAREAQALADAARFDADNIAVTLTADVAVGYLQTVSWRERVTIARQALETSRQVLAIVQARYGAGYEAEMALASQRSLVASRRQILAEYEQHARQEKIILAVLLGRAPQQLRIRTDSLDQMVAPSIASGVPASLLTRRSDLVRAERMLAPANANIDVARAAMLPGLTLSAGAGAGHTTWRDIMSSPIYSLVAAVSAPIFDGGRLSAQRDAALARRQELVADYRRAVIRALGEVELALNANQSLDERLVLQAEAVQQGERALALAESRYRAGAETLLAVLDAQHTLYAARDTAAEIVAARLSARVDLFKALGGGWSLNDSPLPNGGDSSDSGVRVRVSSAGSGA